MLKKILMAKRDYSGVLSSLLAIFIGLLVGFLAMLVVKPSAALSGLRLLVTGGFFNGLTTFGSVFFYATPIVLCGLGDAFAFKASIFNIGGPGQMHVGALVAVWVTCNIGLGAPLSTIIGLLCGAIAGA